MQNREQGKHAYAFWSVPWFLHHSVYRSRNPWGYCAMQLATMCATGCIFCRLARVLLLVPVLYLYGNSHYDCSLRIHAAMIVLSAIWKTLVTLFASCSYSSHTMHWWLIQIFSSPLQQDHRNFLLTWMKLWYSLHISPNGRVWDASIAACIREIPNSNLDRVTSYLDTYRCFPQLF